VLEYANEGIDTVETYVPFTLPDHVENLRAVYTHLEGGDTLIGNSLDNHIVGAPFTSDRIFGLEGNDTLDGGGRHGGYLDGGPGNDRLIVSFGELVGGPGADTFVAGGRGAHTAPDVPIHVLDFTPDEGDRIEIGQVRPGLSAAQLYAQGYLRFDPGQHLLVLYDDPTAEFPRSVVQVFVLHGVTRFDPAWIVISGGAMP
jgi:Ca2+-binding RTX toxin-like protein